ncbi:hypothetical protein JXA31_04765 [Candidatus Bathyarchaeota archaeon]|nr:hypothetical protein [Candidatus Bathyarchaeota archaeon]
MIQRDDHIQTLAGLGLTLLQAKTYLALAKLGKTDVKTIAKASNVARQDIYRLMPTLEKLGLAEKIIAKPTTYNATPIKEGLSILLQNRKKEYAELQKKTKSLINNFHPDNAKINRQEENTQFKITSETTLFLKMQKSLTQKTQTSIDIIVPLIIAPSKLSQSFSNLKEAIGRDIKIRLITQKAEKNRTSIELQALEKNPVCELKYLATPVSLGMHIFDEKEMTLSVSEKNGLPCLWSSNRNLVKLAASYFDEMWRKAQQAPNPNQKQKRGLHAKAQNRNSRRRQTIKTQQS